MSIGSLDDSVVVQFEISVAGYFQFSCRMAGLCATVGQ
jgi:hypothetical protein